MLTGAELANCRLGRRGLTVLLAGGQKLGDEITFRNVLVVGSKGKLRCGDEEEGEFLTLLVWGRLFSVYRGKN